MTDRFTLRRNGAGFAAAIDCEGWTVLNLVDGAERNEACGPLLVDLLNNTTNDVAIAELLSAAGRRSAAADLRGGGHG